MCDHLVSDSVARNVCDLNPLSRAQPLCFGCISVGSENYNLTWIVTMSLQSVTKNYFDLHHVLLHQGFACSRKIAIEILLMDG